ncbi:MAG: hypothetical protein RI894_371, partial [Bacteroidota bacterium]
GAIAAAITPKTKAIIPVDVGGMACHYEPMRDIIYKNKHLYQPNNARQKAFGRILLLADAAHSLGAIYKGQHAAHWCDAACYSFHAVKNLTTAEGGAIAFNFSEPLDNTAIYNDIYRFSLHGQTKDALAKTLGNNSWEYDVVEAGYKMNMPDVLAAIGLAGMPTYAASLVRRREICAKYNALFSQYAWAETPIYADSHRESSCHLYLLRIKEVSLAHRNAIITAIFAQEVSVNVHYKPLPLLTLYKNKGYDINDYPVAQSEWEREISLPLYPQLTDEQIEQVVKAVVTAVAATMAATIEK